MVEPLFALIVVIAMVGIVTRGVIGVWTRRDEGGRSASSRLAQMEQRIQKIEEATSGLIAEFAAVRERERFMTQLVESQSRREARTASEAAAGSSQTPAGVDTTSPFVVQTVSAIRRTQ